MSEPRCQVSPTNRFRPNHTLQWTGGIVAVPTLLVQMWVSGGFVDRR